MILKSQIFLLLVVAGHLPAQEPPKTKALWVVRDVLKSRAETDKMIAFVEKARITDVFLQVRGRGDAYYNSAFVSRAEGLPEDWDPLAYVITKFKLKNIRIHVWLNVFYLWSSEKNPRSADHLFYSHPQWSAVSKSNLNMMDEGVKKLSAKNVEGIFVSPASDEFRDYFKNVVDELLCQYDVDGIHLDYVRYPGEDYDYSTAMRSKFILEYHRDPMEPFNGSWPDSVWTEFRRAQVSDFVGELDQWIKSKKPSIRLSAAVWADLNEAENRVLQEWPEWIARNRLDFVVMMNYTSDQTAFEKRIGAAREVLGEEAMKRVVVGISLYNQNLKSVDEKWKAAGKFNTMGISFFSYETARTNAAVAKKVIEFP